ncbi:bifunctional diaminohydroxyphosphoribosylaminopyrimidine deaminase/5-amino-6-(5-phosphoribosylamino)uracil reductase RibD [Pseudooceanicola sp. CBS1P-1]|uniref:Riboflavin biosynthesis protein RibD n=1 Tax=Pseudooceanicola albus TaxID=2692189 RepID=A0A6L7G0Y5_9RHOB|nr:bifunctional diaminohydroxyphosphoribosylaminopyrimidine deaminase/5-amino-6-(5-phosphoribosylamino)uracil reductase RibD [Pseudooceanicola endophyticus]MXN16223.1 bifunctional diaminohydroxyphosphoribosylaminopyrimidine deaminase/5-amino-6-(5-phosphoribosylamino)uracil reductase RibD [Pseudooceanicola albus]
MALALSLGRRGQGNTWPNPAVGCVLVREGRIVGRGWTQPGGRPHAEPMALRQAGPLARGATAYVSLEPCSHYGQTPPCAKALIEAGVARVVAPFADLDPRVEGRGFAMLREAGIEVATGLMTGEAARDLEGFFLNRAQGRPRITLKLALSLDGKIATATGESQWITGPEARREVHAMRMRHDAVMVGAGTARIDDPSLTVRGLGAKRQPVRVVVSRRIDLPLLGTLARSAREVPVWICHGRDADGKLVSAWKELGATLIPCALQGRQLDILSVMQGLGSHGLTRVFCEGGGALAATLLGADLVDELIVMSAGVLLGAEGRPGLGAMGIDKLSEAPRLTLAEERRIGPDMMTRWTRPTA